MLDLSFSDLTYSFSCRFLWYALSLFHYLDEEVSTEDIGKLHLKWSKAFNDLAGWATDEWYLLLASKDVSHDDIDKFALVGGRLGDSLTIHFANALNEVALQTHARIPSVHSTSIWLFYCYCRLMWHVLKQFERVLWELGRSSRYYRRYRDSSKLFQNVSQAIELERPFERSGDISESTRKATWDEINMDAARLSLEWREAVFSAAHNLKLPDYF